MRITTNIRGKTYPQKKMMSDDLHECLDCKGCICEEFCKEEQEKYFGKKEGDK